jgi:hypothetical protein
MLNAERSRQQDQSPPLAAHAPIGRVISVRGSQASIGLSTSPLPGCSTVRATVGRFLGICAGESLLIGVITRVLIETPSPVHAHGWHSTADVDLIGEIKPSAGSAQFQRGVTDYPAIGDSAVPIGARELRLVYNVASASAVAIGHLQQDSTIAAYVDIDDMLCKHFAVLGTTGVGKSSAVVLLLQEFVRARPNLRILILDAHNEYGRPFGEQAFVLNPRNLKLPFWLFNFRGDGGRLVRSASGIGGGSRYSLRSDPAGEGRVSPLPCRGGPIDREEGRAEDDRLFGRYSCSLPAC